MLQLDNLREHEEVKVVIKRHWIVYVLLGLYVLLGIGLCGVMYMILGFHIFSHLLLITFLQVFALFLYVTWLDHELDMYIVTNCRIIGVEQISFLNREVSECNLGQVQEVNSKTKGFFANMLNYGTLSIQTAGTNTTMKMTFAPNSMQEARKILNIVDTYKDTH